jgi:tRNA 2-thiouridine synthesizing protein E
VSEPAVDKDGFLRDLAAWNEDVAKTLARGEGITLTAAHWAVIRLLRDFYARTGVAPAMRPLVKLVRETLGADRGTSLYLLGLFPGNPAKVAAKIAGLPRPTNCL